MHVTLDEGRRDFDPKENKVRNLGYPEGYKNTYWCKDDNGGVVPRRDVVWDYNGDVDIVYDINVDVLSLNENVSSMEVCQNNTLNDHHATEKTPMLIDTGGIMVPTAPTSVVEALSGTDSNE